MSVRKHLNYLTVLFARYAYVACGNGWVYPPEGKLYVGNTLVGNVTLHADDNTIEFITADSRSIVFDFDAFADSDANTMKARDGNAYVVAFFLPTNEPARDLASCL